ncbi:MAG: 16S rRNA (cytosine(967)-C(5))-methyltransferase RsmB [Gammaproteobacteria bacterium]|nr:16S rRNA (cytosine(967)-C(5))-methyltransferase RsmB [Gammaproteobacteria bacterium]MDH5802024.1 16S rRNA (cytosine(967)-C(5))-methyltransferase RsmB [Gammaproteobacteria bacterium]
MAARPSGNRLNARTAAVHVLTEVISGASLSRVLPLWLSRVSQDDQALLQEFVYGVLRWYHTLNPRLALLLSKPLKAKDQDVHYLLLLGLYQLLYMRIPQHAAVTETVKVTQALRKDWARGLVNGVLRSFLRLEALRQTEVAQGKAKGSSAPDTESARYSHPQWVIDELKQQWPRDWELVLQANNQRPPMTLRVNQQRTDVSLYLQLLQEQGLAAVACDHSSVGLTLRHPCGVEQLPGFTQGLVSVQDQAAQLAAPCLQLAPGQRVLDACAAPGGKTAHILESHSELEVVALDQDGERLQRVAENLQRLGLSAVLQQGDAATPQTWWDGVQFDRILVDAPCTASGVLRRHPDAKVLKKRQDIEQVSVLQAKILDALWPLLRPGGMLLYVTCSVWPRENSVQLQAFLQRTEGALHQPLVGPWGRAQVAGRQILAGEDNMDGFFYGCVVKQ